MKFKFLMLFLISIIFILLIGCLNRSSSNPLPTATLKYIYNLGEDFSGSGVTQIGFGIGKKKTSDSLDPVIKAQTFNIPPYVYHDGDVYKIPAGTYNCAFILDYAGTKDVWHWKEETFKAGEKYFVGYSGSYAQRDKNEFYFVSGADI